jgi:hypothetical protein
MLLDTLIDLSLVADKITGYIGNACRIPRVILIWVWGGWCIRVAGVVGVLEQGLHGGRSPG